MTDVLILLTALLSTHPLPVLSCMLLQLLQQRFGGLGRNKTRNTPNGNLHATAKSVWVSAVRSSNSDDRSTCCYGKAQQEFRRLHWTCNNKEAVVYDMKLHIGALG